MPSIKAPTDAFIESGHKEFTESPHHERGDSVEGEAGVPMTYTVYTRLLGAFVYRHGTSPDARTGFEAVFLRVRTIFENTNDPVLGGATTFTDGYTINVYDGATTDADAGDPAANQSTFGMTLTSATTVTDDDTEHRYVEVWDDGSNTLTITTLYDQPNTLAAVKSKLAAIYAAKRAAWVAAFDVSESSEYWKYDGTGTIVTSTAFGSGGTAHFASFDGGSIYLNHWLIGSKVVVLTDPDSAVKFRHEVETNDYNTDPASSPTVTTSYSQVETNDIFLIETDTTEFTGINLISSAVGFSEPP